jgi:hypothetical protein
MENGADKSRHIEIKREALRLCKFPCFMIGE